MNLSNNNKAYNLVGMLFQFITIYFHSFKNYNGLLVLLKQKKYLPVHGVSSWNKYIIRIYYNHKACLTSYTIYILRNLLCFSSESKRRHGKMITNGFEESLGNAVREDELVSKKESKKRKLMNSNFVLVLPSLFLLVPRFYLNATYYCCSSFFLNIFISCSILLYLQQPEHSYFFELHSFLLFHFFIYLVFLYFTQSGCQSSCYLASQSFFFQLVS